MTVTGDPGALGAGVERGIGDADLDLVQRVPGEAKEVGAGVEGHNQTSVQGECLLCSFWNRSMKLFVGAEYALLQLFESLREP